MQQFIESTLAEARAAGCDTVQLKYDGMGVQFACANGRLRILNFSMRDVDDPVDGLDPAFNCTFVGTYLPYKKFRWVYDCWLVEEDGVVTDLRGEPYRSRYVAAKIYLKLLNGHAPATLVTNHPISAARDLWSSINVAAGVKGLVFRDSKADARAPVRIARWYAEVPKDL